MILIEKANLKLLRACLLMSLAVTLLGVVSVDLQMIPLLENILVLILGETGRERMTNLKGSRSEPSFVTGHREANGLSVYLE